ncbi:MAG TPA: hypothetical protein VGI83_06455 [Gemmatimonadales bacterium]|jgi:hypothetical protein
MRTALVLTLALMIPGSVAAQRFATPDSVSGGPGAVRLGLLGFSAKGGADFKSGGRAIASVGLDLGDLFSDRVRIRPSLEIGIDADTTNYIGSAELMYRFTPDSTIAVPYVLFGLGLYGQQHCNVIASGCPKVLAQFGLGFEIKLDAHMNWMLEYHGEDALRRHRVLVGLTTRRAK